MDLLIDAALLQAFLLENVAEFKVPLLVTAQDRDQPGTENAAVRYTIVDGDPGGNFRYFKKGYFMELSTNLIEVSQNP